MSQAVEAPEGVARRVPVEELAPHPENVRSKLGDVTELATSIAEQGVLQPLTVVSLDAFLLANPGLAEQVEIGNWVVIAGHRRLAAAQCAMVTEVPVIVRDDLAGAEASTVTMIVENVQRAGLTPTEEARAFGRLREKGWSERKIAKATGVSHGQVHKRLSLLRLPEPVVAKLEGGDLTIAEALKLLELPDEEILSAWREGTDKAWLGIAGAVARRLKGAALRRKVEETRALLERHDVEVVDDVDEVLGEAARFHRLPWNTKVEAVNPVDTLATVGLRHGDEVEVTFYSRSGEFDFDGEDAEDEVDDAGGRSASGGSTAWESAAAREASDARTREIAAEREARWEALKAAAARRAEVCGRVVASELDAEATLALIAHAVLTDTFIDSYETIEMAARWCGRDGDPEEKPHMWGDDWVEEQAKAGGEVAVRAVLALGLADIEESIKPGRSPWPARGARHVRWLVEHAGHTLSEVEQAELAASDAAQEEGE